MPRQKAKPGVGGVSRLTAMLSDSAVRGRGRHSSLTRWLQAHHDEFAAMLSERQPRWEDVAKGLTAMGLRDGEQKPPNGERVRKAWWYARQEATARLPAASRSGQMATPMVARIATDERPSAPVQDVLPAGVEAVQPSRSKPRLDIRPATRLSGVPADPVAPIDLAGSPALPVPAAANAGVVCKPQVDDDQVAEELRRVLGQMQVGKTRLPKVVS